RNPEPGPHERAGHRRCGGSPRLHVRCTGRGAARGTPPGGALGAAGRVAAAVRRDAGRRAGEWRPRRPQARRRGDGRTGAGGAGASGLAAMRALHGKRGFATVERGLASEQSPTRMEALETLLNFGPGWLAGPLARLLEPESFDPVLARPLSHAELESLTQHSDK